MKTELINLNENMTISVAEDTQFVLDVVDGVEEKALTFELLFEKEGVSAEIISLNNIGAGHSINLTTITKHLVPNTACITTVKSVLNDNSKSTFIGKIIINSKASQTSSFLYDHVLVVGENTKNNSQPILQIDTDDVKASHGATTGRVDKDQLFYLTFHVRHHNQQ